MKVKKPIKIPMPRCKKCGKILKPQFITEKDDEDKSKPEYIIIFGRCNDCKVITIHNLIETKNIPNEKDLKELLNENK